MWKERKIKDREREGEMDGPGWQYRWGGNKKGIRAAKVARDVPAALRVKRRS